MTLFDAAERFASLDRSKVTFDESHCLHAQDRFATCERCYAVCPVNAIHAGKPPALDAAACQNCLACLPVCPTGAFRTDDDVQSLLSCATHVEGKAIEMLCGPHPNPDTGEDPERLGIRIAGCLAGLGSGAYLALAALGLEQITLRLDACAACRWGALSERIRQQAALANQFLAAWHPETALACTDRLEIRVERPFWNAKNPPLSRRDLFRMLGRQGQVAMARAMEQGQAHASQRLGRDRLRLLAAMAHLPTPVEPAALDLDAFDFAFLSVSEACNACGTCALACPTGALLLEKDEAQTTYALRFQAQHCISCQACMRVCAPAAIKIDPAPAFAKVFGEKSVTLQAGELAKCERCGAHIAKRQGARLCAVCEYRRKNPFGSMAPPGFTANVLRPGKDKK